MEGKLVGYIPVYHSMPGLNVGYFRICHQGLSTNKAGIRKRRCKHETSDVEGMFGTS